MVQYKNTVLLEARDRNPVSGELQPYDLALRETRTRLLHYSYTPKNRRLERHGTVELANVKMGRRQASRNEIAERNTPVRRRMMDNAEYQSPTWQQSSNKAGWRDQPPFGLQRWLSEQAVGKTG